MWTEAGAIKEDRLRNEFMRLTRAVDLPELTAPKVLRHAFATALQEANVDPLIRNQLMGHALAGSSASKGPLGMTGVYSHAGPATIRRQMEQALRDRPALEAVRNWVAKRRRELAAGASPPPAR